MTFNLDDPRTWVRFKPQIIAHDVGRSFDRSTAVFGGCCPFDQGRIGISEFTELPHGYGTALANALAQVDRNHEYNSLVVADLTSDASYGEILHQMFGRRLIGVHITRYGNGMDCEPRQVPGGCFPIFHIGRTELLNKLLIGLETGSVRLVHSEESVRAYNQLAALEAEIKDDRMRYVCSPGQHDDLAISMAMLAWAAQHPRLPYWFRNIVEMRTPRKKRPSINSSAWT